jgi:hypothetical protein
MLKKFFRWLFSEELAELKKQTDLASDAAAKVEQAIRHYLYTEKKIENIFENLDVSVDVHQYSPSWAVISLQGEKTDYVKFVTLKNSDIREIQGFLKKFDRMDRIKIDATPGLDRTIKEIRKYGD